MIHLIDINGNILCGFSPSKVFVRTELAEDYSNNEFDITGNFCKKCVKKIKMQSPITERKVK